MKLNLTSELNSQKSNVQRTYTLTRYALQSKLAAECLLGLVDIRALSLWVFPRRPQPRGALSLWVFPRRQRQRRRQRQSLWFMQRTICEAHVWSRGEEARHLRCGLQRHRDFHLVVALQEVIHLVAHRHQVQRQVMFIAIIFPELASFGQTIPGRHAI